MSGRVQRAHTTHKSRLQSGAQMRGDSGTYDSTYDSADGGAYDGAYGDTELSAE